MGITGTYYLLSSTCLSSNVDQIKKMMCTMLLDGFFVCLFIGQQGFPGIPGDRGVKGPLGRIGNSGLAGEKGDRGQYGNKGERVSFICTSSIGLPLLSNNQSRVTMVYCLLMVKMVFLDSLVPLVHVVYLACLDAMEAR
jgi:hypothetical protein